MFELEHLEVGLFEDLLLNHLLIRVGAHVRLEEVRVLAGGARVLEVIVRVMTDLLHGRLLVVVGGIHLIEFLCLYQTNVSILQIFSHYLQRLARGPAFTAQARPGASLCRLLATGISDSASTPVRFAISSRQ